MRTFMYTYDLHPFIFLYPIWCTDILNGCWEEINGKGKVDIIRRGGANDLFRNDPCKSEKLSPLASRRWNTSSINIMNSEKNEVACWGRKKERWNIIIRHRHHKKSFFHTYIWKNVLCCEPLCDLLHLSYRFPPITMKKNVVCTYTDDTCEMWDNHHSLHLFCFLQTYSNEQAKL